MNSMQLIIHSVLVKVDVPANAMEFNTKLAYVFNLEILNVDGLIEAVFDFTNFYQEDEEEDDSGRKLSQDEEDNFDREELAPDQRFQ